MSNKTKEQNIDNDIVSQDNMTNISNQKMSKDDLLKALDSDFATNVQKIYVNSLGREVGFREVTVQEQKNLSRILVANENRKDIVYDAQCAIINKTALDDDFDIYELTEFDRIKLLMALYQQNMFADEMKFTCQQCGTDNVYKMNFDSTLMQLDKIDLKPKTFEYQNSLCKYEFTTAYPNVKDISDFHRSYFTQKKASSRKELNMLNSMFNIEYVDLFVKNVIITNKSTGKSRAIVFSDFNVTDIEDIFAKFPQDVMYHENGLINFITENYLNNINKTFEKHVCMNCGAEFEKGESNRVESFF